MVRKDLLDILACPKCREKVTLSEDNNWLVCEQCALKYPVEDDIPIMLIEESEQLDVDTWRQIMAKYGKLKE